MPTPSTTSRAKRAGALATLVISVLAVGAGLLAPPAGAQDSGETQGRHPRITDEQRQCMADAGFERPLAGQLRTREQRQAFRDAAEGCGIDLPPGFFRHAARRGARHWYRNLTDEQRQCLTDHGVERPARGERPTPDQIQAFRDAAAACGIELPAPADS